jgi:hypothetical protein
LTLKLTYYDDITPKDYEPEYFTKESELSRLKFDKEGVLRIKIGQILTTDHTLQLRFAHIDDSIFEETDNKMTKHESLSDSKMKSEFENLSFSEIKKESDQDDSTLCSNLEEFM